MDELTHAYLDLIKSKKDCDEQELFELLLQYREAQQDLIRQREHEKLRYEKLYIFLIQTYLHRVLALKLYNIIIALSYYFVIMVFIIFRLEEKMRLKLRNKKRREQASDSSSSSSDEDDTKADKKVVSAIENSASVLGFCSVVVCRLGEAERGWMRRSMRGW